MLKDYINNKPTINSERFLLRPFKCFDVNDLKEWTPNKEIYKYWGKNPGKCDLKPELLLEKIEKPNKSFHLYIEYKKDKKVIGDIYVYLITKDKKAKIAIRINPKYQNIGLGTEVVKTMCDWCFRNTELETIWTDVDKNNLSSIKMLEKVGFDKIKEIENGKMVSKVTNYFIFEINKSFLNK